MRRIYFLLALLSVPSFAQFEEEDSAIDECRKNCCISYGGSWEGGACAMLPEDYNGYFSCDNACLEQALEETRGAGRETSLCCAPAFLVLGVLGLVFWGEKRAFSQKKA
ncbi:MAG: hypothetical protein AB1324_06505 [Candidatus Micrarchaeota archaeon]